MRAPAFALILLGTVLLALGLANYRQEAGSTEPTPVTTAELRAQGPPPNPYVRITDAQPEFNRAVRLTVRSRFGQTKEITFVPIVSRGANAPNAGGPANLVAVVELMPEARRMYVPLFSLGEPEPKPVLGLRVRSWIGLPSGGR